MLEKTGAAPWALEPIPPKLGGEVAPGMTVGPSQYPYLGPGERGEADVKPVAGTDLTQMQAGLLPAGLIPLIIGGVGGWLGGLFNGDGGVTPSQPAAGVGLDLPLVGPGVAEPPNYMVKKRWEIKVYSNTYSWMKLNYYALTDGRIAMYHNTHKYWKVWRPKKNVVISSNPRLKDLKKLDRLYQRMQKTVKKFAPKVRVTSRQAPSQYLSAVERKALK